MRASGPNLKPDRMRDKVFDEARFFRGWLQRPLVMGAVSPSSQGLGRAMAAYVAASAADADTGPVLELGPGTGVVTQCLIDRGIAEERLVLVEYSADFCRLLRARFPRAHVIEGDAYAPGTWFEAAMAAREPSAIVSSLPLFTKPELVRQSVLASLLSRMPAGRPFVQFSYALTLPVKPERVAATVETSPWIKRNLPPARVLVYRRPLRAATGGTPRNAG